MSAHHLDSGNKHPSILLQQQNDAAVYEGDKLVTSENFFEFLVLGKEIFLSSLASMEAEYPDLCVFKEMDVFKRPEWIEYKRAVQAAESDPTGCLPPRQDTQVSLKYLHLGMSFVLLAESLMTLKFSSKSCSVECKSVG
jgi:hypothetical protein